MYKTKKLRFGSAQHDDAQSMPPPPNQHWQSDWDIPTESTISDVGFELGYRV